MADRLRFRRFPSRHPFPSHEDFMKTFAPMHRTNTDEVPPYNQIANLLKFLQAFTIIRHPSILPLRNLACREVSFARDEACNSQIDEFMQKTKQEKDKHNSSIQDALVQKPGERPSNIQVGLKPFVPDQPLAELQLPDDAEMVTLEDTE